MITKDKLEHLYHRYNRRKFVHPDPLEFLYRYERLCDREVVAFVASSLAYGRVAQILKSVSRVLERMTPSPWVFLNKASAGRIRRTFAGFKHRFTTGEDLSAMLVGIKYLLKSHGFLHACFAEGLKDDDTILPALCAFTEQLTAGAGGPLQHLVPSPQKGSACKRLNLFLRWMVRRDKVDPGGWDKVSPSKLIVPVDVHMHRIGLLVGLTKRRQADMRTAVEITKGFRAVAPDDPVKYDFSLTRLGIRGDVDLGGLLKKARDGDRAFYSSVCSITTL
ncbi:MAG: TIGR02757 family protein [Thermodesulfobacteriota bacterium]|nr:TIGR02757 family protein [Thermodesulfobacteriota bacterium]